MANVTRVEGKGGVSWRIDYFDPDGKRIRRMLKKRKDADRELAARINAIDNDTYRNKPSIYNNINALSIVNAILDQIFCKNPNSRHLGSHFRMAILARDDKKCAICGKNGNGTILEVDHIIPFSEGGTTIAGNLQVLCKDCNIGKSNIFK